MKKVLIGILIGLIVGVGSIFIYNEFFVKKDNATKTDKKEVTKKEEIKEEQSEELDVNSDQVTGLMKKINVVNDSISAGDKFGYFYKKDKYSLTDISDEVKIYLGVSTLGYDRLSAAGTITKSEMDSLVQSIFGKNVTYNDVNVEGCVALNYDASNNSYSIVPPGCGGTLVPRYESKIISAIKYDNRIEVVEKVVYIIANPDENGNIAENIYKQNQTELLAENVITSNYDQYFDKTDSYKYTFKLENGNYYFESVEKIN